MVMFVVAGVLLVVIAWLLAVLARMQEATPSARRPRPAPPPPPLRDWEGITGRLEKRVASLEAALSQAQSEVKERDKTLAAERGEAETLRRQVEQDRVWREKEEAAQRKDRERERVLEEELLLARTALNAEQTERIKQDHELRDRRQTGDEVQTRARQLSARVLELERQAAATAEELRRLQAENGVLRQKKEAESWVAIDDYRKLEGLFKRARWEADLFRQEVPRDLWPGSLRSE